MTDLITIKHMLIKSAKPPSHVWYYPGPKLINVGKYAPHVTLRYLQQLYTVFNGPSP